MKSVGLVVFTRDLRVHDNPTLNEALNSCEIVVPVFVFDPSIMNSAHASGNRIGYLCECLYDLRESLRSRKADLIIRQGDWLEEVLKISHETNAESVYWAREVSSFGQKRDLELTNELDQHNVEAICINSHTVVDPDAISPASAKDSREFKVFTPYYRRWTQVALAPIKDAPKIIPFDEQLLDSDQRGEIPNANEFVDSEVSPKRETGGETQSRKALNQWVKNDLINYETNHDLLALDKTSHISSALHFGTLSAHEMVIKLRSKPGSQAFIRQLCWRDFYHQILFHNPHASWRDYSNRNDRWNENEEAFEKWCQGQTGYPLIDAAMRQLKQEGFMHNRARMVVASFLTKDLYIDWKKGAAWFMKWLTDGDLANNNLNWQWTAGTGTDTNPNRIFNPIRQSERFDPEGIYIKRYVPELKNISSKDIHFPHHLRDHLDTAHMLEDYPLPLVDHSQAIAQYRFIKEQIKSDKMRENQPNAK